MKLRRNNQMAKACLVVLLVLSGTIAVTAQQLASVSDKNRLLEDVFDNSAVETPTEAPTRMGIRGEPERAYKPKKQRPPTVSPRPTPAPTSPAPTVAPTIAPTTVGPTTLPTEEPSARTMSLTRGPTNVPVPTLEPTTQAPTNKPTDGPTTENPTTVPTELPTSLATESPTTTAPTGTPSVFTIGRLTRAPTDWSFGALTRGPTQPPAASFGTLTRAPTNPPVETTVPTTQIQAQEDTPVPTLRPTSRPTANPTPSPTALPTTANPTALPTTANPTERPTPRPTARPTPRPTVHVNGYDGDDETSLPTMSWPTSSPSTARPTGTPTTSPTTSPSTQTPTDEPTTEAPTTEAPTTKAPTTEEPTTSPPTEEPTASPTEQIEERESSSPSSEPSTVPSALPTSTSMPSNAPTGIPTFSMVPSVAQPTPDDIVQPPSTPTPVGSKPPSPAGSRPPTPADPSPAPSLVLTNIPTLTFYPTATGFPTWTTFPTISPQPTSGNTVTSMPTTSEMNWQLEQSLTETVNEEVFGAAVSLSGDGTVVTVGAFMNSQRAEGSGRIVRFDSNTDTEAEIFGRELAYMGYQISTSRTGDQLVTLDSNTGIFELVEYNPEFSTFQPVASVNPEVFPGSADFALSGDGKWLAIVGETFDAETELTSILLFMYEYNEQSKRFVQYRQSTLFGQNESENWGFFDVDMDYDGKFVVVSQIGQADFTGKVHVYERAATGMILKGEAFASDTSNDGFGQDVEVLVNPSGQLIVGFSVPYEDTVYVYTFEGDGWNMLGSPIISTDVLEDSTGSEFGFGISFSDEGDKLLVGAPAYMNAAGAVQGYIFVDGDWLATGNPMGWYEGSSFGEVVECNSDCSVIAVGAPLNCSDDSTCGGAVYVFRDASRPKL